MLNFTIKSTFDSIIIYSKSCHATPHEIIARDNEIESVQQGYRVDLSIQTILRVHANSLKSKRLRHNRADENIGTKPINSIENSNSDFGFIDIRSQSSCRIHCIVRRIIFP